MASRPGPLFFVGMFVLAIVTMLAHEFVHLIVGLAFGAEAFALGLTQVRFTFPEMTAETERLATILVSISGPVFTVGLGLIGAALAFTRGSLFGFELLFVATFQRLLASCMSVVAGVHNDEARVSLALGWEWWMLPALVIAPLILLTIAAFVRLRLGLWTFLGAYVALSVAYTVAVGLDGQLPGMEACDGVLSRWYDPVFGCAD